MTRTVSLAAALTAVLAGCEQISQTLPFDQDTTQPVSRSVAAEGGTLNSAAGASVAFPAGALGQPVQVTLTPLPAASALGTAAGTHSFRIEPAGTALLQPVRVDLALGARGEDSWLSAIVLQTGDSTVVIGDTHLDLTLGTLRGEIGAFGTVTAVTPPSTAVLRPVRFGAAQSLSADAPAGAVIAASPAPTRIHGQCNTAVAPCALPTHVEASDEILNLVQKLGIIFPRHDVDLRLGLGTPGTGGETVHAVTGSGAFSATLKGLAGRAGTATRFRVELRAEAGSRAVRRDAQITLQGMRVSVAQCSGPREASCVVRSNRVVDVPVSVEAGSSRLTLEAQGFQFNNQPASLRVLLPLTVQ